MHTFNQGFRQGISVNGWHFFFRRNNLDMITTRVASGNWPVTNLYQPGHPLHRPIVA